MNRSTEINELAAALAKAQAEMKAATKSGRNPQFKRPGEPEGSKYAGLPDVVEAAKVLHKYDLAYTQDVWTEGEEFNVACCTTTLMHKSGQWKESPPLKLRALQNTPQGVGSAITYAKRYSLSAQVAIVADEDDDGNAASARAPVKSNGNGHKPAAQPPPDAAEKLSIEIKEGLEGGFASLDEKLRWKQVNRDRINALPPAYRQAIVAAYEAAPVNP